MRRLGTAPVYPFRHRVVTFHKSHANWRWTICCCGSGDRIILLSACRNRINNRSNSENGRGERGAAALQWNFWVMKNNNVVLYLIVCGSGCATGWWSKREGKRKTCPWDDDIDRMEDAWKDQFDWEELIMLLIEIGWCFDISHVFFFSFVRFSGFDRCARGNLQIHIFRDDLNRIFGFVFLCWNYFIVFGVMMRLTNSIWIAI